MSTTEARPNSSGTTVLAMLNNMLGGAMLSFPILFKKTGLISSTLVLLLSGIISFVTCRVYVLHGGEEDKDVEWTIRRILGAKWEKYFRFITGSYLILLSIISLDLIVDQLYSIIYFFLKDSIAAKDEFSFTKFSLQWLTLVLFVPLLGVVFLKNLNLLVKLSQYGSASIFIYMGYVAIQFIISLVNGQIEMGQIEWWSWDAGSLAGTCSLAFTIHTVVITFMKQNRNQENNIRDLGYTYFLGFIVYEAVSLMGAFAIAGSGQTCTNTLIDCYLNQWTVLFVEVSYFFGRVTTFPLMLQVGRNRLIQLFYGEMDTKRFKAFNLGFMIVGSVFSIASPYLPLSTLMSVVGAVVCYFFIYLIPSKIHLGCLYSRRRDEQSLVESITSLEQTYNPSKCTHVQNYRDKNPKILRYMIYGGLNVIGIVIMVFGLYSTINDIANK